MFGRGAFDRKMDYFARQPISNKAIGSFANALARTIRPFVLPNIKVIALDLDNVLWGGILSEDGLKNICDHLVYLGINDGGPMYDKLKLHNEDNDENDPSEVIEKLDDSYTGFYCYHPSSRSIVVYLVYCFPNKPG